MRDAARFTRGLGRYVADLPVPNVGHVAFARSTEAHARITRLDVDAAREHPDALAVITSTDLDPVLVNPYWGGVRGTATGEYYPLARDKVRWVGEPVVAVVAPSRYIAEDIAELVEIEYEPLPPVVDPEAALDPDSAHLYENWGSNVYYHDEFEAGDLEEAFASAAGVVERRLSAQRHTGAPLEPRGIIARFDPAQETIHLDAAWQDVYLARAVISRVLDWPEAKLVVAAPDSGGGFGVKLPVYPEELACAAMAVLLDGAWNLRWIQDRQEDLLGTSQHRDMIVDAQLAHDANGKILGLKARVLSDAGAYGVPARGNTVEGIMAAADVVAGGHAIPAYSYTLDVVMTNKAPLCVYRGVAQPVTVFIMDRLLDEVAAATGVDRREVRRINLLTEEQFPYATITGEYVIESGSYVEALDEALRRVDFDSFPEYQQRMRDEGRYVGLGIACGGEALARGATWYGARGLPISGQEGCQIKMDSRGKFQALLGTTRLGQGIDTAIAQIVADELGVELDNVTVTMGDTDKTPYGSGAWASRQATLGGTAAVMAAKKVRDKLFKVAAYKLEANPDDLELGGGRAFVKGNPANAVSLEELAHAIYFTASEVPDDVLPEPTIEETAHFDPPAATFANATHAAIVEVIPSTAEIRFLKYVIVHDCGTIINPLIVDGQLYGATAQGIGGTIYEHVIYDEAGQPLATTFMDYLIPTSHEVPELELVHIETGSPFTALGIKGVGESGTVFSPAAIATGVSDALGVEVNRLELNPSRVYELLEQSNAQTDGR
jgi:carbon-monoxide dehydrogenase large subunit